MNRVQLAALLKQRIDLMLCLFCVAFFLAFPKLDLTIAAAFYDGHFYWNENFIVKLIYKVFAKIHVVFLLALIGCAIYFHKVKLSARKHASLYLLCCLIIGPGILVNAVLKDNSVGRPRPVHIAEFGGSMQYTPVFNYSGECSRNCSFVSGHASIGFYAMALFWATRQRRWLITGLGLGGLVGFTRIVQGGHFFSDVVFAGWVVYFTCLLLNKYFHSKFTH